MTRRLTLLFAALLLVLAACGGGGGGVEENGGGDNGGGDVKGGDATTTTADDNGGNDIGGGGDDLPAGQDPEPILGEDDDFDALAGACFEENMFACDALFTVTPAESDIESYAQTCGGRIDEVDGAPACAEEFNQEIPEGQNPGELGDDPDLDALADGCFEGDMDDCDQLFGDSPSDSDYEAYAEACGGRLPTNDLGFTLDCAIVFAGGGGSSGDDTSDTSDTSSDF